MSPAVRMTHSEWQSRGLTLMELMVASALSVLAILAIGQIDVTRVLLSNRVRDSAASQAESDLALVYMTRALKQADLLSLISPSNVQFRTPELDTDCPALSASCPVICTGCIVGPGSVPPTCCFDIPGNYVWAQYKLVGNELVFYRPAVPCTEADRFRDIASLTMVQSTNVLEVAVNGRYPTTTRVEASLAPVGVSPPPPGC